MKKSTRIRALIVAVPLVLAGCLGSSYSDGQVVGGTIPLDVTSTPGDIDASGVEFVIDGDISLGTDTEAPYVMDWDTTQATNGPHQVTYKTATTSYNFTLDVQNAIDTPVPGTVCMVGDSITFQSFYPWGETDEAPSLLSTSYGLGWTVDNVSAWLTERVGLRDCATSISAMAMNDVNPTYHDGFTAEDEDNFTGLWNTARPSACKVQVLPYWGTGLTNQTYIDNLTNFRNWALQQDAEREDLVTIDWMPYVQENPWVMDVDGIHLAWADYPQPDGSTLHTTMLEAAVIRQNSIWQGTTAACESFINSFEAAPEELVTDPEEFALAA